MVDAVDWYEQRHSLIPGMVFATSDGAIVRLDRRVPGDGTNWYADIWVEEFRCFLSEDVEIHPGDLSKETSVETS